MLHTLALLSDTCVPGVAAFTYYESLIRMRPLDLEQGKYLSDENTEFML